MSTYHLYYLGYRNEDGLVYPLGPFDNNGKMHCVSEKSRSFASDLYEDFCILGEDKKSRELIKAIYGNDDGDYSYEEYSDWEKELRYLPIKDLGSSGFIKKGFFLLEDIHQYLKSECSYTDDLFYESMTPEEYALKTVNEMAFGEEKKPKTYDEGEEFVTYSCRDYAYFAYPDYGSREYDAFLLRATAEMLDPYDHHDDIVALYRWA